MREGDIAESDFHKTERAGEDGWRSTVRLPTFRLCELCLKVDFKPRMIHKVSNMRAGVMIDVKHGEEELAKRGSVGLFPAVLFDHDTFERPRLEVADVTEVT